MHAQKVDGLHQTLLTTSSCITVLGTRREAVGQESGKEHEPRSPACSHRVVLLSDTRWRHIPWDNTRLYDPAYISGQGQVPTRREGFWPICKATNAAHANSGRPKLEYIRTRKKQDSQDKQQLVTGTEYLFTVVLDSLFISGSQVLLYFKGTGTIRDNASDKSDWMKIYILCHAESQHRGLFCLVFKSKAFLHTSIGWCSQDNTQHMTKKK